MINRIYAIYDRASKGYGPLFLFPNDDVAKRSCAATVREPGAMKDFPDDYYCVCFGTFDGDTAQFELYVQPQNICELVEFVKKEMN